MDEIDETERQREAAMEIIAKAGAARSCAFAAIHRAKALILAEPRSSWMRRNAMPRRHIRCTRSFW